MSANGQTVSIDTALYDHENATLIEFAGKRGFPKDFQVCKGSAWMILSRPFCSYLITGGLDGLPRRMVMYFTNFARPAEEYFQVKQSTQLFP